ncbi:MAG: HAMP domain-containing histidine kinase [Gammaproteobacteria bacterium SHHR-1]|uniref:sensor histidine kinase n=1 Tax=Magnetovirga frankeli TaxID=947516 RepID=UPI0012931C01|nr:HAMP domain-containing histidine kinase [gamma proteobacterium SS-5]
MNFSDILASSIHDIKNSLGIISNNLDELLDNPDNKIQDKDKGCMLKNEVQRANNNMIQLLTLYKMGVNQIMLSIQEINVDDLLSELIAENQSTADSLGLTMEYDCDPYLCGFFDEDMVRGVLNSTIGNAQRYAKGKIRLSASQEDDYLVIRIEDDGNGYPQSMLDALEQDSHEESFSNGRTQLGLYFADQVARLHSAHGRQGSIKLYNNRQLPGSCFELRLP